jgi:hypothetical protein
MSSMSGSGIIISKPKCIYYMTKNTVLLYRSTLSSRRTNVNLSFAKKSFRNEKYQHWFVENNPTEMRVKNRSEISELLLVQAIIQDA